MTTMTAVKKRDQPLQLFYRPREWGEIVGHAAIVKSLKTLVQGEGRPHVYLFTGPSGCGKTTIARILATEFGCKGSGLIELDGASTGSVEDIRTLTSMMEFMPQEGKAKVVIVDECHAISKAAWQAFLKSAEDTPSHAYYIFATTDAAKVPETLKTRATSYELKPVPSKLLVQYGTEVICPLENINLPEGAIQLIADESHGSPRQFLNYLGQIRDVTNLQEVRDILVTASADETDPIIQIAKNMVKGEKNVATYLPLITAVETFGGARAILRAYIAAVGSRGANWEYCHMLLEILDKMPLFPQEKDGKADLMLMVFRLCKTLSKGA